jgi:two-component system cell cycle response regulator
MKGVRVLVVDDDPTICRLFAEILTSLGYEVVTEGRGDRVMEQLERQLFDVVLLDLVMPSVGGLELLREVRAEYSVLPIIIVTGYGSFDSAVEAMRAGASDLIAKPIDAAMLDLRIKKALDLEHARRLANTDGLTGVYNHRYLQERLAQEVTRANRHDRPLALLLLDLDEFKVCNDTWGHPFGDQVLIEVSRLLRTTCRTTDLVARYGGEEFAVVLPETEVVAAEGFANRLRRVIADSDFDAASNLRRSLPTVSIGAAGLHRGESKEDLIRRADGALYAAKRAGRDCVVVAAEGPAPP